MEDESHQNDIPIWFNGTQRWMTGLTKRTTCDDVIYALLYSNGLHELESTDNFAIFEKWREVERPLSARTKIVKVWSFWGEEQPNVQLSMRSLDDYFLPGETNLYMRSRRRHKKSARHRTRHPTNCKCHNKRGCTECSRLRSLEQLVKLVVSQERKIQDLSDRVYDTDRLIEKHEARIHHHRVQQNGLDYVQNSYLNSHSSESSSSVDGSTLGMLDIKDLKTIFQESNVQELEEIARICDNLAHVERRIAQEQAKIKEMQPEVEKRAQEMGVAAQMEGETNAELEDARVQMIRAVTAHVTNEYNERELERKMENCTAELMSKTDYINQLQKELSELEGEQWNIPSEQSGVTFGGPAYDNSIVSSNFESSGSSSLQSSTASNTQETTVKLLQCPNHTSRPTEPTTENYRPFERGRRGRISSRDLSTTSSIPQRERSRERRPFQVQQNYDQHIPHGTVGDTVSGYGHSPETSYSHPPFTDTHPNNCNPATSPVTKRPNKVEPSHDLQTGAKNTLLPNPSIGHSLNPNYNSNPSRFRTDAPYSSSTFSRDNRSLRRSRDVQQQQYNRLIGRSRSADRSTSARRERSPGFGVIYASSQSEFYQENSNRPHHNVGFHSASNNNSNTQDVVNQYGLEIVIAGRGRNSEDSNGAYPTKFDSRNPLSTATNTYQSSKPVKSQEGVSLCTQNDSNHTGQWQQMNGLGYSGVTYTDNDTRYPWNSNKQNGESSNARSGAQACLRDPRQELRTSVNMDGREEKGCIQPTSLNTLGNPRADMRGPRGTVSKDSAMFEQSISGTSKMWSHNKGGVQRKRVNTEAGMSLTPHTNTPTVLSRERDVGLHSFTESQPPQVIGYHHATGMDRMFPSRDSSGYDNNALSLKGGDKNPAPAYSHYKTGPNSQSDKQTNDEHTSGQATGTQIGRQTPSGHERQDGFRHGPEDNRTRDASSWLNMQHQSSHLIENGPKTGQSFQGQQSIPNVNSDIYRSSHTFTACVPRISIGSESVNRTLSESDDVFIKDDISNNSQNIGSFITPSMKNNNSTTHISGVGFAVQNVDNFERRDGALSRPTNVVGTMNGQIRSSTTVQKPTTTGDDRMPNNTHYVDSIGDKSSNRGALYHIVSNKMNKSKSDQLNTLPGTSDTSPSQHNRTANFTNGEFQQPAPQYIHSHDQSPIAPKQNDMMTYNVPYSTLSHNGHPLSNPDSSHRDSAPVQGPMTVQRPVEANPAMQRSPHGRRRALNPHFCDVPSENKSVSNSQPKRSGAHSNGKNNQHTANGTFQNTVNQVNGVRGRGILKKGDTNKSYEFMNGHENQVFIVQQVDTVNIKDIIGNRDAGKDHDHFRSRGNGGVRVTIATNGHSGGERTKAEDSNDSNSDTGLSSMHSDEISNMETLV